MSEDNRAKITVPQISRALGERAQDVIEHFLGEKIHSRSAGQLRYGKSGGIILFLTGPKKGRFENWYETDCHGDMLDFIAWHEKCSTGEAIKIGKAFLGWEDDKDVDLPPAPTKKDREEEARKHEESIRKKKRVAFWLWSKGGPVTGTAAEAYLKGRGITILPEDLIRHRKLDFESMQAMELEAEWKAGKRFEVLIFKATDKDGKISAIQQVVLDGAIKADIENKKRSNGYLDGAAVKLGEPDKDLVVAEGPETGFSIKQATGVATWIVLGAVNFPKLDIPASVKRIWIAVDNDENGAGIAAALRAAQTWMARGIEVRFAIPSEDDFNDTLQLSGEDTIRAVFRRAVKPMTNPVPFAERPLIVSTSATDALTAWRATGAPVKVVRGVKEHPPAIAPISHLVDAERETAKKAIVILTPGEKLKEGRGAYPDVKGADYRELKLAFLGLAEVFGYGGDEAVARLLSLAPPVGAGQLWGLEVLALKPKANVILTRGKKACQAARRLFPEVAVLAWSAPAEAADNLDLTPLAGRKVFIAPAEEEAQIAAAKALVRPLVTVGADPYRFEWPLYLKGPEGSRALYHSLPEGYGFERMVKDGWRAPMAHEVLDLARPLVPPPTGGKAGSPAPRRAA